MRYGSCISKKFAIRFIIHNRAVVLCIFIALVELANRLRRNLANSLRLWLL